jgi:polar amino acid transport system ATP-binding protein
MFDNMSGQPGGALMLEIRNLQKSFDSDIVLNDVNFTVEPGEIVAVMGPSGCGKSTFIRCVNRLVEPDEGQILFQGQPVHELGEAELEKVRRNIGFVFQHFNLINRLSVRQNISLGLVRKGMEIKEAYQKAHYALEEVDLLDLAEVNVTNLSGGEKQRVGLARALVLEPDLILLDEPTASLDPILVRDVLEIMEEIARENDDRSMIVVTHEVTFARRVADRVLFMDQGRFIESGPPEEIFNNPVSWIGKKYKKIINYN